MNQSHRSGDLRSTIDPYYSQGDVFRRDERYYDQIVSRRDRTPLQNGFPSSGSQGGPYQSGPGINVQPQVPQPPSRGSQSPEQLARLRRQYQELNSELHKLAYGGEFGTGDVVMKRGHYTASKPEMERIRSQENQIRALQQTVRANNQRLIKFQKASNELEIRVYNIQAIDKEIYRQLKGASTRDKELLERANSALLRGEPKENVLRILEQIVIS